MVQSPTKRGVVVIGGRKGTRQESNILIELSGESREALQWTILDQKLQRGRCAHVSFLVPDETVRVYVTIEFRHRRGGIQNLAPFRAKDLKCL